MKVDSLWLLAAILLAAPAEAARRPFTATFDTEMLRQGEFELDYWLTARMGQPAGKPDSGWIWLGPTYGLNRVLEVAIPFELVGTPTGTSLADLLLDTRVALTPRREGEAAGGFNAVLRLVYQNNVNHPFNGAGRSDVDWVAAHALLSAGNPLESHATLDVAWYGDAGLARDQKLSYHSLGLGYAYQVSKELRVGGEYFHEISLSRTVDSGVRRFQAGPDINFSCGQMWTTLGVLRGLSDQAPDWQARWMVGVSI